MQGWQRGLAILDGIYVCRLLGMFLLFPVFSLHAQSLDGASPQLVGLALGAYGLTQGLLQIPFGMLSDRFGRKRFLVLGLALFALGSLWAAQTNSMAGMIGARLLQGMGAVSGVILAYVTDLMPREKLALAMGIIGASIGLSFLVALAIAPPLEQWLGMRGMFYLMAALAIVAALASLRLPSLPRSACMAQQLPPQSGQLLWASALVFVLHFLFTGSFVILPQLLQQEGLRASLWLLYLPSNLLAMALMRRRRPAHLLSFGLDFWMFALGLMLFVFVRGYWGFLLAFTLFFIAFYRLETALPHFAAAGSTAEIRGKMMAYFTSSQFLGSFLGGTAAGIFWHYGSLKAVFALLALAAAGSALILFYIGKKHVG